MNQIRRGVFETNSSSTHSLTICSSAEYKKWENGEVLLCMDDGKFYSKEDAIEMLKAQKWWKETDFSNQEEVDEILKCEFDTFKSYGRGFDTFDASYTTENGDKVIAFGYAGFDG